MPIRVTLNGCIRCLWACDSLVLIFMSDAPASIIALGQARFDVRNWGKFGKHLLAVNFWQFVARRAFTSGLRLDFSRSLTLVGASRCGQ